jgi:tetratricopeptide (TPR) repeat protein
MPLSEVEMLTAGRPPVQGGQVVVIGGRTLVAQAVDGQSQAAEAPVHRASVPAPSHERATVDIEIPGPPPDPCNTSPVVRAEARRHVDMGDGANVAGDAQRAVNEYRAAIAMDPCNSYGWASLGDVSLQEGRPDLAIRALRVATQLQPGHYGALTNLGLAYESIKQPTLAAEAYQKALVARPDHGPAAEGLERLGTEP